MALHEGPYRDVQTEEHLVTPLPPNEADGVGVAVAHEEGHCMHGGSM